VTPRVDPLAPDMIAATVLAVPGVASLHPGTFGEVASYLPGRRVVGVRRDGQTVEVHVVLLWGAPALATAEAVRRSLTALGAAAVHVVVQDVVTLNELGAVGEVVADAAGPQP
jgi:hypothetical protein